MEYWKGAMKMCGANVSRMSCYVIVMLRWRYTNVVRAVCRMVNAVVGRVPKYVTRDMIVHLNVDREHFVIVGRLSYAKQ